MGHARKGNYVVSLKMLKLLKLLRMVSLRPDELTYTSLLSSCSHSGLETDLECFLFMGKDKVTPDIRLYGTLVIYLVVQGISKKQRTCCKSCCHDMARLKPMTLCYMGRTLDHYTIYYNT